MPFVNLTFMAPRDASWIDTRLVQSKTMTGICPRPPQKELFASAGLSTQINSFYLLSSWLYAHISAINNWSEIRLSKQTYDDWSRRSCIVFILSAHSPNLCGVIEKSPKVKMYFGNIQKLYLVFSCSFARQVILQAIAALSFALSHSPCQ